MVPVDDVGQAATEPQARIAATASSANQLTSKRTIVPGINLFFMAISGKSTYCQKQLRASVTAITIWSFFGWVGHPQARQPHFLPEVTFTKMDAGATKGTGGSSLAFNTLSTLRPEQHFSAIAITYGDRFKLWGHVFKD
jgi:hypothetical protein